MSTDPVDLFGENSAQAPRKKKASSKPVFKKYEQHQVVLLPPSLEELIPAKHLVRTVDAAVDNLNIEPLLASYKGGGTSSFHPLMMLKVLVYAYLSKTYTSRRIAKALREDINYMWLSGMQQPDFRTLNLFRAGRLKETIDDVFGSMVMFLHEGKYINLHDYFVDGTKHEANANRYSHVWSKNTKRHKERVQEKIRDLIKEINDANAQEDQRYADHDLPEMGEEATITSEKLKEQVQKLNSILQKVSPPKRVKKALAELEREHLPKLRQYEDQERLLEGRNSYSKTDPGATFFRLKSGELRPCYNVIIGTENQFLINYTIDQTASETNRFTDHMRKFRRLSGHWPKAVIGDPAYGSEENYHFLRQNEITPYVRYSTYSQDIRPQKYLSAYDRRNFIYHPAVDSYECPEGRLLPFKDTVVRTARGYTASHRVYQSRDCTGCPVASLCKKGRGPRSIQRNDQLERFRAVARAHLASDQGRVLYSRRGTEVESVFGDTKHNQGFRRFNLRGVPKVNTEMGLLAIAHNIKKISSWGVS